MVYMETHYVDCMCSDLNHTFRFTFDPDDGDLWLEVRLHNWMPWYKRVALAAKYVFNRPALKYGHYDTTMIDLGDATRIRELMDRVIEAHGGHGTRAGEDNWVHAYKEYVDEGAPAPPGDPYDAPVRPRGGT